MFNFALPSFANTLLLLAFAFVLFYLWVKYEFSYWKRRGVYSPPATFLVGHLGQVALMRESIGVRLMNLYNQTKEHKYVGIYMALKRTLLVNDLDMAKNILQKDHDHFISHGFKREKELDPLGEHLFNLDGEEWKRIRAKLTPTFTSSKMKYMFETMLTCSDEMILHIDETVAAGQVVDMREVIAKFGTDVIGSCAFGIQTNSFKHPDAEFRTMGKKVFVQSFSKIVTDLWTMLAPSTVPNKLIEIHNKELTEFFTKCVKDTVAHREANNISKNDFLQLLIEMKNSDEKSGSRLTLDEMVPQVFIFFVAGFETSSTVATYAFLELAKHQDIQDKARAQIDKAMEENNGKVTYEMINQMSYLTQIVNESLRMYPPLPFLFRKCNKDYKIPGTKTVIEKDTLVLISSMGIHRDPEIYTDPLMFDPDRFSKENIGERHQYSHIPFGEGPRICIGSRFGLLQVKIGLFMVLRNFKVDLIKDCSKPVEFDPKAFLLHTEEDMSLRLTRRSL